MSKPVFSLRNMLLGISAFAVALALLLTAWQGSAIILWNIVAIVFVGSLVAAIVLRRERQAFHIGFFVCGVAYLYLSLNSNIAEILFTDGFLNITYELVAVENANAVAPTALNVYPPSRPAPPATAWVPVAPSNPSPYQFPKVVPPQMVSFGTPAISPNGISHYYFRQIGHGLFALLFAVLGGVFAKTLWLRANQVEPDPVPEH